jgi:hypothetical protein
MMAPVQPKGRTYKVVSEGSKASSTALEDLGEAFHDDSGITPALGRGASAAIAGAAERVSDVINRRLDELSLMRADIDREAADFVRHMSERASTLQAHIESYARQCADVQQQIKDAGKRLGDPVDLGDVRM